MSSNNDRDIARVRMRFIDLVKSFFLEEPDAEKLSRWRGIFSALASEPVNKNLDEAVARIVGLLESGSLQDVRDEYYTLFSDPFSEHLVSLSASFYIDGKSHGPTLAEFRGFLATANIEKAESVSDAEDTLPVMIDCLASLIEMEKDDEPRAKNLQDVLVKQYIAPLAVHLNKAFQANEKAVYYKACGQFLLGYAELDQALFEAV